MDSHLNTQCFVLPAITPHLLAFIGRNGDHSIITDDNMGKMCYAVLKTAFKGLILLPRVGLKALKHV